MTVTPTDSGQPGSETFVKWFGGICSVLGLASAVSQLVDFVQSAKYSALLYTAACMILFLAGLAAVVWRRPIGKLLERLSGSPKPRYWFCPAFASLFVVLALLWSVLIGFGVVGSPWKGREEQSPVVVSAPSRGQPPGVPWIDSFDGRQLDPTKWRPAPMPDVVHVRDGQLRFDVALAADDQPISRQELAPVPSGRPIGEVDATITAEQTSGEFRGGVVLFVRQEGGTVIGIGFGPSKAQYR